VILLISRTSWRYWRQTGLMTSPVFTILHVQIWKFGVEGKPRETILLWCSPTDGDAVKFQLEFETTVDHCCLRLCLHAMRQCKHAASFIQWRIVL
jgi:hypothetical protein